MRSQTGGLKIQKNPAMQSKPNPSFLQWFWGMGQNEGKTSWRILLKLAFSFGILHKY